MILILTDKVNSDGLPASKSAGKLIYNAWRLFELDFDSTDFLSVITDDVKVSKTTFYTEYYENFVSELSAYDCIVSFSELPNKFRQPDNKLILPSKEDVKKRKFDPVLVKPYFWFPHSLEQLTSDTKLERNGYKHRFFKFLEDYHKLLN